MTTARYLVGDVFQRMAELPDGSVDLVMTSPPFYGLRSYLPDGHPDKAREIGSEPTPADYMDTLLRLTAEWGRLLAPHGSIVVELGDTYAGSGGAGGDYDDDGLREGQPRFKVDWSKSGFLPKSLCGIPGAYAQSLACGWNVLRRNAPDSPAGQWRVRNKVAWVRPNPPVGALGDKFRPATSYLTIATRARDRYFDLDSVRVPASANTHARIAKNGTPRTDLPSQQRDGNWNTLPATNEANPAGAPPLDWWNHVDTLIDDEIRTRANGPRHHATPPLKHGKAITGDYDAPNPGATGSHIRRRLERAGYLGGPADDVWDIAPTGFSGAHYAVYPPELCVRPILAMTPPRVCTTCGQPSRRIVETGELEATESARIRAWDRGKNHGNDTDHGGMAAGLKAGGFIPNHQHPRATVGWSDCGCPNHEWRPGHVLDPFAGSGTTLAVATGHGRTATGIDLDPRNADLARDRIGLFLEIDGAVVS